MPVKPADPRKRMNPDIDVTRDSHGQIEYFTTALNRRVLSPMLPTNELLRILNRSIHRDGRLRRLVKPERPNADDQVERKAINLVIADLWKEAVNRGLMSPYTEGLND